METVTFLHGIGWMRTFTTTALVFDPPLFVFWMMIFWLPTMIAIEGFKMVHTWIKGGCKGSVIMWGEIVLYSIISVLFLLKLLTVIGVL